MTAQTRFSVVLPVYNRARRLKAAVASVMRQSVSDWELIIVDDASTDAVADAIAEFSDPRIRPVVRAENGGVAAAQNTGLAIARGEYVAFLHSDDRFRPEKLAVQGAVLDAAPPEVLAVESAFVKAGETTVVRPRLTGVQFNDLLALRTGVHVVPMLFRRTAVAELKFDSNLRAWEDWDLLIRLLRRGKVFTTDDIVAELQMEGDDRLVDSPWMLHGLEHLLNRYANDLAGRPAARAVWHLKLGRAYLRCGSPATARRHFLRCVRDDWRRPQRLMLVAGTLGGHRARRASWRLYQHLSRRAGG